MKAKNRDILLENIVSILTKDSEKDLSKNTILTYMSRIKWLKNELDIVTNDIHKIIQDWKKIIPLVSSAHLSVSSIKLQFVVLSVFSKKLGLEEAHEEYSKMMNEYKDLNNFQRRENKVSAKNSENWATWKEIQGVYEMIPTDSWENTQNKLIIGLYCLLDGWVLRLDFANVRVHTTFDAKRQHNWLYWDQDKAEFKLILKQYKTASKYGDIIIDFQDPDLKNLLFTWFTVYNKAARFLLLNYRDKKRPLSETSLSHHITFIFEAYLGKKINNQLLRQIKESYNILENPDVYNDLTLNQKIEIHRKLLHSFETAHEYSKKDPGVKEELDD